MLKLLNRRINRIKKGLMMISTKLKKKTRWTVSMFVVLIVEINAHG
jgi:uncharacterized membrane protein YobD (UPF0266 family)